MRKIKEALRMKAGGASDREAAHALKVARSTVAEYIQRTKAAGLAWPLPEGLDDRELEARLFPPPPPSGSLRPLPDWPYVLKELKKKGVTLQLLWLEYKAANSDGYQYTQFCHLYRAFAATLPVTLRQEHKAGERAFVDYAGMTIAIFDKETGEAREAEVFVGALGASSFIFCEATWTQALPDWCASHSRMYEAFGGVPRVTVPDNLKSGVNHPSYYEPDINPTYADLAAHYGTAIIPARVKKPQDKAKVESGVQVVERRVLAPLRNHRFFSLAEANGEIARLIEEVNTRAFQKLDCSRAELLEELDRPALGPLPPLRYEFAEWRKAKVSIDYHIQVDYHLYSVPYSLARAEVEVRLTAGSVEVLHKGRRVACHVRSYQKGHPTTEAAHMPASHRAHLEWTPSRIVAWAGTVGPNTATLAEAIMESRPHPEQGYRACLGIMRLGKGYSPERLEAAARRALASGAHSYRSVESILKAGLDRVPLEPDVALSLPTDHQNLRGSMYFAIQGEGR